MTNEPVGQELLVETSMCNFYTDLQFSIGMLCSSNMHIVKLSPTSLHITCSNRKHRSTNKEPGNLRSAFATKYRFGISLYAWLLVPIQLEQK